MYNYTYIDAERVTYCIVSLLHLHPIKINYGNKGIHLGDYGEGKEYSVQNNKVLKMWHHIDCFRIKLMIIATVKLHNIREGIAKWFRKFKQKHP